MDVVRSAIERSHDELFEVCVNLFVLISFLDEYPVQIGCRFHEELRFGAYLTVPVELAGYDAVLAFCCYPGLDM